MITSPVDFLKDRLYYEADVALNQQREVDEHDLLAVACSALVVRANELQRHISIS